MQGTGMLSLLTMSHWRMRAVSNIWPSSIIVRINAWDIR